MKKKFSYKKAVKLYEKIGMSAVIEYADKFNLPYKYCNGCDTLTPSFENACAVCGLNNK